MASNILSAFIHKLGFNTDRAQEIFVGSDTFPKHYVEANGNHWWGTGSAVADTNLYRSDVDQLRTDDSLLIRGHSAMRILSGVYSSRPAAGPANAGMLYRATDVGAGMVFICDGTNWIAAEPCTIASNAPVTIANTTVETTLLSITVPANFLTAGTVLRTKVTGAIGHRATSGDTFTIRNYIGTSSGGNFVTPSSTSTAQTNRPLDADWTARISAAGATGTFEQTCRGGHAYNGTDTFNINRVGGVGLDTTATVTLKVTGQWSVANASNTFTSMTVSIEIVRLP